MRYLVEYSDDEIYAHDGIGSKNKMFIEGYAWDDATAMSISNADRYVDD